MKKLLTVFVLLILSLALLTACGGKEEPAPAPAPVEQPAEGEATAEPVVLKVGASITPHAEVLKQVIDDMAALGVTLEVIEFTDYVQPNTAVESGDLDANYFQHVPYMEQFNADNGTHIVAVANLHYEPFGIYAGKTASLEELADGAIIGIPNDGTNEARALFLLEANGLIKLNEGVDLNCTVLDIAENPKNLEIKELEAAQITLSLPDVDLGVINGNYALQAGLKASKDALALEDEHSVGASTYPNVLCVKEGNEDNEAVQKLITCLHTDEIRQFILDTYEGSVVPLF